MCTSVSVYCHYFNAFHEVNPAIISKNDRLLNDLNLSYEGGKRFILQYYLLLGHYY